MCIRDSLRDHAKSASIKNIRIDSSAGSLIDRAIRAALQRLSALHPKEKIKKWVSAMIGRVNKQTSRNLAQGLRQHENINATIRMDDTKEVDKFVDFIGINRQLTDFYAETIEGNISLIQSISITGHDALKSGLLNAVLQLSLIHI